MKITVDKSMNVDGNLVFTITCKEPHVHTLSGESLRLMEGLDYYLKAFEGDIDPNIYDMLKRSNHDIQDTVFQEVLTNLRFAIENELRPKFRPICQEVYNWIYDKQEGHVKEWLMKFDPQRTTYYFDNDVKKDCGRILYDEVSEDKVDDDEDED